MIRKYLSRHRTAVITILAAGTLDVLCGVAFAATEHLTAGLGVYWAVTTAATVGYGDISPKTNLGHYIAILVMLTVVPLFAATFSLFTSGLTAVHIRKEGDRHVGIADELRRRLDHVIQHHPDIPELPALPPNDNPVS